MSLKDRLASDLDVFFNIDEFAETVNINGTDMNIIIDDDELKKRKSRTIDGTFEGETLFQVKKSVYGDKPGIGEIISFGGRKKRIYSVEEEYSVYIITLEAFLS